MAGCRCWPAGAARRASCSTSPRRAFVPPPKVTSSVVRARAARRAAAPATARALRAGHRGRLRPAPQDAAPEPEIARRRSAAAARGGRHRADRARRGHSGRGLRRARARVRCAARARRRAGACMREERRHDQAPPPIAHRLSARRCARPSSTARSRRAPRCWCASSAAASAIPTCTCRTAISRSATTRSSTCAAGRTLPFTLGHEIAGVDRARRPATPTGDQPGRARRGLSLDRLRRMRGLPRRRGEPLRRAAPSRHLGRRRLRHPRAGAASALSDRLRAAVGRRSPAR